MELTQLKYFRAVSRHEHFTRAAEELHIAQPSLSKAISNLEEELGVALFDRDKRSVHLNGYGQAFLRRAERILAELDEAVTEIRDMKAGAAGGIHIASAFLLDTPGQLADFVGKFYFDHPNIHVHVFYQDTSSMADMLKSRRVDFALATGRFNVPGVEEKELLSYRLGLVVSRDHELARRKSVRLGELTEYPFLSNNSSPNLHDSIYEICAKAGFRPKIAFECDNSDLIGEAVSRGMGISFVTEHRYQFNQQQVRPEHPWTKKLLFIPVEDEFCLRTIYIAYLRDRYQTAAARVFLSELMDYVARYREG